MSYQPRRYRNPIFEEIERNFGFDDKLVARDRALDRANHTGERPIND